jgi:hypothetical protein
VWKSVFAASALALLAACTPAQEEAAVPEPAVTESAKLMTWGDLAARPQPTPSVEVKWG